MSPIPAVGQSVASVSGVRAPRLQRELGLFDVFAVSTGAMFSSGFFLLPGLAYAGAGPSIVLAYLIAGLLILPAMFSMAELSTALPRAGGSYFFLDRSLGPLAGTIGGLGTYLSLTLKTAFALIGIGAYAAFFIDLPIRPVAIALTIVFVIINILGAKETTALQRWLVIVLLAVMALFIVRALLFLTGQPLAQTASRFMPFLTEGAAGLFSTVGFVFVSYIGLTKVASVAEEVRHPERNIPLGMILSLAVTSLVYVLGVFVIVAIVDPAALPTDLTPVATAAEPVFTWLPARIGLLLIVIAALAAFASTGNAGMLSASRYPLAMARDRLLPQSFSAVGRFHTPVRSILGTGGLMILFIAVLDVEGIAKLASAFQLFIFVLINLAVIVMRESRIPSYDPGYRSPLYPWMQIFGMIASVGLIASMGWGAVSFIGAALVIGLVWYFWYAAPKVRRHGAIYHWFRRLGQRQFDGLDREFRGIMKEKGLRDDDPFDQIVARCSVIELTEPATFSEVIDLAAARFAERMPHPAEEIRQRFLEGTLIGHTPVTRGVAIPHFRTVSIDQSEMVLVRSRCPITFPNDDPLTEEVEPGHDVEGVFFVVSPEHDPAQHLRILAQIAGRVDEPSFAEAWRAAVDEHDLRRVLLRDERSLVLHIRARRATDALAGKRVRTISLPEECLVAVIHRDRSSIVPRGETVLERGDRVTIIGQPEGIAALRAVYEGAGEGRSGERRDARAESDGRGLEERLRAIAARYSDRDQKRVQSVLSALERLERGTYGACTLCGSMIADDWLHVRPDSALCLDCQLRAQRRAD